MDRTRGIAGHCALLALSWLGAWPLVACGGGARDGTLPDGEMGSPPGVEVGAPGKDQVAQGAALFAEHCAECHGEAARGSATAPPLVGANALPLSPREGAGLRKLPFQTADDVFAFVRIHMPLDAPAILDDDDYYAIVAFLLKSHGIALEGKRLDANTAPTFVLHGADAPPGQK